MTTPVTVVVPTFGRPERVTRLLDALGHQSLPPDQFGVIVVADGSTPVEAARLRTALDGRPFACQLIVLDRNRGPGPARNVGWRASSSRYVAFIDDDCTPTPAWLGAVLGALVADATLGLVQGRTAPPPDLQQVGLPRWQHGQDIPGPTPYFEACNIIYRREALERGGFGEDPARWGEDSEAAWSALEAGWRSGFEPAALVHHDWSVRGVRWHARAALGDADMVTIAKRHPGYRRAAFWRPWAIRSSDLTTALAAGGVLLSARWRWAGLATVPWLLLRRPSLRQPEPVRILAEHALVDGARLAGALAGSVRNRCLVL